MNSPCEKLGPQLSAYIDGELLAEEKAQLEAHLRECEACGLALEQLRVTIAAVKTLPVKSAPSRLAERVATAAEQPARTVRRFRLRTLWPTAAAAAVALAIVLATQTEDLPSRRTYRQPPAAREAKKAAPASETAREMPDRKAAYWYARKAPPSAMEDVAVERLPERPLPDRALRFASAKKADRRTAAKQPPHAKSKAPEMSVAVRARQSEPEPRVGRERPAPAAGAPARQTVPERVAALPPGRGGGQMGVALQRSVAGPAAGPPAAAQTSVAETRERAERQSRDALSRPGPLTARLDAAQADRAAEAPAPGAAAVRGRRNAVALGKARPGAKKPARTREVRRMRMRMKLVSATDNRVFELKTKNVQAEAARAVALLRKHRAKFLTAKGGHTLKSGAVRVAALVPKTEYAGLVRGLGSEGRLLTPVTLKEAVKLTEGIKPAADREKPTAAKAAKPVPHIRVFITIRRIPDNAEADKE